MFVSQYIEIKGKKFDKNYMGSGNSVLIVLVIFK